MFIQKIFESGDRTRADFAEHPATGFVYEVVGITKKEVGELEGVAEVVAADEGKGGDDGNAAVPKRGRAGELIERRTIAGDKVGPEDVRRRGVHEVPIIDAAAILKVEAGDAVANAGVAVLEMVDEDEQAEGAGFVVGRLQEAFATGEVEMAILASELAKGRRRDAEKAVAVGVLAFAGLEKPGEKAGFFSIGQSLQRGESAFKVVCHPAGCLTSDGRKETLFL